MSDPLAGLLEGLSGGFQEGHAFRENIKTSKRRRQIEEDLRLLRQQEEKRAQARESRAATEFGHEEQGRVRAESLRKEVGTYLARPTHFKTLGQYISGKPGEREAQALSPDAQRAQLVGRLLGEFGGRDLNDEEALLAGTGDIPVSAIQPRRYVPRTREEYLGNLREAAGYRRGRAGSTKDPTDRILRQANTLWANGYGDFDTWDDALAEAERQISSISGGAQPSAKKGPIEVPQMLRDYISKVQGGGRTSAAPAAPARAPVAGAPVPDSSERQGRVERARVLMQQYHDLPPDELEATLREFGYDEEEIRLILGSSTP